MESLLGVGLKSLPSAKIREPEKEFEEMKKNAHKKVESNDDLIKKKGGELKELLKKKYGFDVTIRVLKGGNEDGNVNK